MTNVENEGPLKHSTEDTHLQMPEIPASAQLCSTYMTSHSDLLLCWLHMGAGVPVCCRGGKKMTVISSFVGTSFARNPVQTIKVW